MADPGIPTSRTCQKTVQMTEQPGHVPAEETATEPERKKHENIENDKNSDQTLEDAVESKIKLPQILEAVDGVLDVPINFSYQHIYFFDNHQFRSDLFRCLGKLWRFILISTKKDYNLPCIGLFLEYIEPNSNIYVSCNLELKRNMPGMPIEKEIEFLFGSGITRGFHEFCTLEKFEKCFHECPVHGNHRVIVTVKMTLFANTPSTALTYDNDCKRSTASVGLINQGATCYLNSLLQALFHCPLFAQTVLLLESNNNTPVDSLPAALPNASPHPQSVLRALQKLFLSLERSSHAVSTAELTRSFGWNSSDVLTQHDAQEFHRKVRTGWWFISASPRIHKSVPVLICS